MTRLKFIDKTKIGLIEFDAYIIEDENKLEAFAVYFQDITEPLLMFQQDVVNEKIHININIALVEELQKLKSKNPVLRKEQFKQFQQFVLDAEQVAKQIAFDDRKMFYVSDVQLIKSIEQAFLVD